MKLAEIAARIDAHLKTTPGRKDSLFDATAWASGSWIYVRYGTYLKGADILNKPEALAYLEWLDAGNVGTHYQMAPAWGTRRRSA